MKPGLLAYLVCRRCGVAFDVHPQVTDGDEILEGTLVCRNCNATFSITRGVPRMLSSRPGLAQSATAEAFGYEWTHYSKLTDADEAEFLDWIKPLRPESFAGQTVLDAGCGKGRHIALAAQFQAREVVGVDLSDAVDAAFRNTRHLPNVHVVQANILHLPFARSFDLAYSIGVLHHLPNPKDGFLSLTGTVRPGGRIAIWVYGKEGNGWIETFIDPLRTRVTSKLPKPVTRGLSFLLAVPLFAALKLLYGPVGRNRKWAGLKSLLPYAEYLCAISTYSFEENFWNVFDHLVAPIAFYHSRDEIEEWLAAAGIKETQVSQRNGNSWRGTGLMPESPVESKTVADA